jgi:glycerophosphoryl diester phosphodiesterase
VTGHLPDAPAWLTARPIAHRGFHSKLEGRVENGLAAASAAIEQNYAIECDIQRSRDGEAMVFHDFELERLTFETGPLETYTSAQLASFSYRSGQDKIARLSDFLDQIAGRVPLIIEIKSRFNGDIRLAERALALISNYSGPACLKSFDPVILIHLREHEAPCPLGLIAEAHYAEDEWPEIDAPRRKNLAALTDFAETRPDFLSWRHQDLPHATPMLFRYGLGLPVMTWTIRSGVEQDHAKKWADQVIFEGFAA